MRPDPRVVSFRYVFAYETKTGIPINFEVGDFFEDERGWVGGTVSAKIEGSRVGYVKYGYIPRARFRAIYPTLLHYVIRKEGYSTDYDLDRPEGARLAKLQVLGFDPLGLHPSLTPRKLDNLLSKRFASAYESFENYHVDRPQVEYSHTEPEWLRKGVATATYEFAARYLSSRGLALWASDLQSSEAKAVWGALKDRGYPVKSERGRLYLAY